LCVCSEFKNMLSDAENFSVRIILQRFFARFNVAYLRTSPPLLPQCKTGLKCGMQIGAIS
jgi:hypothetical protein